MMLMPRDKEILKFIETNKSITVQQATKIFFKNNYKSASRRLKQLEEEGYLRSYISKYNKQKAYYMEKPLSSHDLTVLDVYAELIKLGATIIKYKSAFKEGSRLSYLNGLIKPDGYIEFEYQDYIYHLLIEIDLTHYTGLEKFKLYEKMARDKIFEEFPTILVLRPMENDFRYESDTLDIVYGNIDFRNTDLHKLLLE